MMGGSFGAARSLFLLGLAFLGASACSSTSTDFGQPLSITLTADPDVGVAATDTIIFRYDAAGTDLVGVVLDFGDGQADSLSAQGATTAAATRPHVYGEPGTFLAVASVLEAFGRSLSDTVVVEIQDPP